MGSLSAPLIFGLSELTFCQATNGALSKSQTVSLYGSLLANDGERTGLEKMSES